MSFVSRKHLTNLPLIFPAHQILLCIKEPNDASIASNLQKSGMVQFRAGNLESGRLFLEKAVETYRHGGKEGYESKLVTPLFVIGNIYSHLKQADEAQRVWSDALDISEKTEGKSSNPEVHNVLTMLVQAH